MLKLALFVLAVALAAIGLAWLADKPGELTVEWLGYQIETSVFAASLLLAALMGALLFIWSGVRYLLTRPAALSNLMRRKREKRGLEALSRGLVAVGSGDKVQAQKFAAQAQKLLPGEPLTGLLRAQAAQLHGDRAAAREVFQKMAEAPETEMLGLRGLFLEARRENETEAARQFAERAMERNPDLAWGVNALFELQCKAGDWAGALRTLDVARRHKQIDKAVADRRRAVLLTAQAMEAEEGEMNEARQLALEAHKLAPDLVPAAEIAGRVMASQGDATRAARVIAKTWELNPHPDLALAYAHTRPGESPRERLKRVKHLAQYLPEGREAALEGAVAVATAAVEARDWAEAREALKPYIGSSAPARVCTLMARIEGGETGDQGRVREWLARAVRAPRDPAWTADGYISDRWAPVSPITGELDAYEWKAPMEFLTVHDPLVIEEVEPQKAEQPAEAVLDKTSDEPAPGQGAEADKENEETSVRQSGEDAEREPDSEIFLPPRAPDDPGPVDDAEEEDQKFPVPTG